jgi:ABC-type uncharacterized transport system substrate-binding protein
MQKLVLAVLAMLVAGFDASASCFISIVHSYHKEYAWEQSLTSGLLDTLPRNATLDHIYLDSKRLPKTQHAQQAEKALRQLEATPADLIILCDDNAAQYLGPQLKNRPTPVVYVGLNRNPRDYGLFPADNMTGVLERPLIKRSLHSMCRLVNPDDTRVLILFDSDSTSDAVLHEAFEGETCLQLGKVQVTIKQFELVSQWQNALLTAKADGFDTVYIGLYHTLRTRSGEHVPEEEVIAWANAHATVPIFAFWDFAVGKGRTIGGYVLSGRDQGLAGGEIASEILAGTPPASIAPRSAKSGSYQFSMFELSRFGVTLPQKIRDESVLLP